MSAMRALALAILSLASVVRAQDLALDRLPTEELPVTAPSERVLGVPGRMRIADRSCRNEPAPDLRRRIVDVAIQEWGFFGFGVVDQTATVERDSNRTRRRFRRRVSWLGAEKSERVAASIAGYWSATDDGAWILERQNAIWNSAFGTAARWRDPWSAAFISWVMCESGLGEAARFRRAIAHHIYIDQAIQARDRGTDAAYVAHDVGESAIEPGDMLCSARRSAYRSIADRRRHLGVGVRSHCDIVVQLDVAHERILAIGGNVRGAVNLKLLPASFETDDDGQRARWVGRGRRAVFAHLKLRAAPIDARALETSPTWRAAGDAQPVVERRLAAGARPSGI